ncbi:biotin carboxylase N-terminal domain-containing protein [Aquabacterium sp.]|uniref:acetyl/propionyl/methylcrotonyl-CoA carboxylase subunit alpha n=1 Tax=Aquabacterium sp. TaxID=1872578 RepID=UPI0025C480EB|nr:biotin carboxylase N-terminal domain-containing protein [Aquabacterium sp.]
MFHTLLIANRGEVACRIAATARRLGVRTVAVYSDADADAAHVQACDQAVAIGPAAASESYLVIPRLIEAALATGAQAVHPGYGFLSEHAGFAQACLDAGLVFVGPPPSAIAAMGDKAQAKALMAQAGVPVVPGYQGDAQDEATLRREAERIGYPVLVKAVAGGGGKGMRAVHSPADFSAALAACQREALASFADARVLIERLVAQPRHIEVQVFADTHGHIVHLYERDCSVQRRHQKVLEEAPAPGMTPERRAPLVRAALTAARQVGYVGAGTVEFLCEPDGRFWFMEMNTRLQVEHPVTEAITGLDLVEWQLRVAAGEPLPLTQEHIPLHGHAVEARLCAEDPDTGFLPSTGRLGRWRTPMASAFSPGALRLDSGVREGAPISPHYDPMVAKMIAWAPDRDTALRRLDAALGQTRLAGVKHNIGFVRRLLRCRAFVEARLDTALIEREHHALFEATPPDAAPGITEDTLALLACVGRILQDEAPLPSALSASAVDPWQRAPHWRLHGQATRRLSLAHRGAVHALRLRHLGDTRWQVQHGEQAFWLRWHPASGPAGEPDRIDLSLAAMPDTDPTSALSPPQALRLTLHVARQGLRCDVFTPHGQHPIDLCDPLAPQPGANPALAGALTARMPGRVIALLVHSGQQVKQGEPLALTEAMKMEHTLTAPRDGTVSELLCAVGDQVAEGTELLRMA